MEAELTDTRTQEHIGETAERVLGVQWSKETRDALDEFKVSQDRSHRAERRVAEEERLLRAWRVDEKSIDAATVATTEPEDFIPHRRSHPAPDPDYRRGIAALYQADVRAKQMRIEQSITNPGRAFAEAEAGFLKIASAVNQATMTGVEFATASATRAEALAVATTFTLYLGMLDGMTEDEAKIIRRARSEGRLCSLQAARDFRAGRSPERTAAEQAAAARTAAAKAALAAEAATNAQSRTRITALTVTPTKRKSNPS